MEKTILGHIDCPHCGTERAMEIKHDKNLEPFGYCEECAGQLRVGGKPGRVRKFVKLYPWAGNPPVGVGPSPAPVSVTVTGAEPAPEPEKAPVTVPAPAPVKKARATFADALTCLGVVNKAVSA